LIAKVGAWSAARRILSPGASRRLARTLRVVVLREAQALRAEIIKGLTRQAPGGSAIRPLAALTIAARRLAGFRGRKALIRRGDLRNSITVQSQGDLAFVGVPRSAGPARLRIASVHEYGTDPIVIPITPAMRRFLAALFARASRKRKRSSRRGNGSGVVVTQIPARPFMRPAFELWRKGIDRRMIGAIQKQMGWR